MSTKTIFGREPALFIGLIEAIVAFALTIHIGGWGWDAQTDAIIMAFVVALGGVWGAWSTSETMLGAVLGVLKAGFALALAFNFALTSTQQAMAISIVSAVVAFAYRTQTTPTLKPSQGGLRAAAQDVVGTAKIEVQADTSAAHAALTQLGAHADAIAQKVKAATSEAATPPLPAQKRPSAADRKRAAAK